MPRSQHGDGENDWRGRYIHNYEDYLANEDAPVRPWEDEWRDELWGDEAHVEARHRREVRVTTLCAI